MTEYRRYRIAAATWFFTVNLAERKANRLLIDRIEALRAAFAKVKAKHPFDIDAIVILPDHLHCVWTLPVGDADFSTRWGLIKGCFSRGIEKSERVSNSRNKRGERGLWQRRFWEHLIRDEMDYQRHVDYVHWNPVKHGLARRVRDWPYSSFHSHVRRGTYPENWGGNVDLSSLLAGE
jgi:putative transposase